jgi:uncharacterized protein (TIGR02266 family)
MRILVVDDNRTYREILRGLLAQSGYEVETAGSAAEAVDTVRRTRPALAIVDLYMPGGDGDALCRRLKADPDSGAMPVLMMSGGGRKDESRRCADAGGDEFLVKPVRQTELLLAISRHLHARLRSLRVPVRVPVSIETAGVQSTAAALDLSLGGMFLETSQLLAPGTDVLLDFTVPAPAEAAVLVRGEVAWLNEPRHRIKRDLPIGMGIQFTKMTPEAQSAIGRFLAACSGRP